MCARRPSRSLLPGLVLLVLAGASGSRAHELTGFAALDVRYFPYAPLFEDQHDTNPSLVLEPEYFHEWPGGRDVLAIVPFLRLDPDDPDRLHADLRELNWLHVGLDWELRVGIAKVFWGVTEAQHLVDIINQTDAIEDIDGEEKLGQPMAMFSWLRPWGTLSLFMLPGFRERTFAGRDGRLRFALPVETDEAEYESSRRRWRVDWAARWSQSLGDWDVGLAHFVGTSREPRFVPKLRAGGVLEVIPFYDTIQQTSLDLQATLEDWLLKLEAIHRVGHGERFYALGSGFEYSFVGVAETAADLGLIVEYMYDERSPGAPPTALQNDVFVGLRLALNDVQSTELLAGISLDLEEGARLFTLEASRRVGDRWRLEVDLRVVSHADPADLLFPLRRDDHLQLRIARYF